MKTGIELIAEERKHQENREFNAEHDARHRSGEINDAAICYAMAAAKLARGASEDYLESAVPAGMFPWPWEDEWWKPSASPVRNLVKAGALIAAEIDRLNRLV